MNWVKVAFAIQPQQKLWRNTIENIPCPNWINFHHSTSVREWWRRPNNITIGDVGNKTENHTETNGIYPENYFSPFD